MKKRNLGTTVLKFHQAHVILCLCQRQKTDKQKVLLVMLQNTTRGRFTAISIGGQGILSKGKLAKEAFSFFILTIAPAQPKSPKNGLNMRRGRGLTRAILEKVVKTLTPEKVLNAPLLSACPSPEWAPACGRVGEHPRSSNNRVGNRGSHRLHRGTKNTPLSLSLILGQALGPPKNG